VPYYSPHSSVLKGENRLNIMPLITYLVEDSATIRENLISTLEELASVKIVGFSETEDEAARWLNDCSCHWKLAIVDLFLREGSGLGVLQLCQRRSEDQKVVVLTNYATDDIRERCLVLGADAIFDKSNELEELIQYCLDATVQPNLH
jgi:two-component system, OmpR family, response regulator